MMHITDPTAAGAAIFGDGSGLKVIEDAAALVKLDDAALIKAAFDLMKESVRNRVLGQVATSELDKRKLIVGDSLVTTFAAAGLMGDAARTDALVNITTTHAPEGQA